MKMTLVGLLVSSLLCASCGCRWVGKIPIHQGPAEAEARRYGRDIMGYDDPTAQCAATDSDNNSYVSCTVSNRVVGPDGKKTIDHDSVQPLECKRRLTPFDDACRAVVATVRR